MTYTSAYSFGPGNTPASIKLLITLTCLFSIGSSLLNPLFLEYLGIQGPNYLLSLSWFGLKSGYLWQPMTYLFVEDGYRGLTFGLLITLFFQMYIVWIMGTPLTEKIGAFSFWLFYLSCGAFVGLMSVLIGPAINQTPFFTGPAASIAALWVVWTMMNPSSELLFFFLVPIKAKQLLLYIFSAILLVNLSQGNLIGFVFYLMSGLFGYFYGVLAWGLQGPYRWMESIDDFLCKIKVKLHRKNVSYKIDETSKIIDIHTGKAFLNDDDFVEAMLTKISQKGEHSLTWTEKHRLNKISEKKYPRT